VKFFTDEIGRRIMRRNSTVQIRWGTDQEEMSTEENHDASNWRELLALILRNPREKQQLLDELKVKSITLTRWINGQTEPRQQNLQQLVKVLTRYCDYLPDLLKDEKKTGNLSLLLASEERISPMIPSELYALVLAARAYTPANQRFWTIANMILRQAMEQLDVSDQGVAMWITCCMRNDDEEVKKIRSLYIMLGYRTRKLERLEQERMFLGVESAEGEVLVSGHPIIYHNLQQAGFLTPETPVIDHCSAVVYPITYQGLVAGTFSVVGMSADYFLMPERVTLVQRYSELLALALAAADFVPREKLLLGMMPSYDIQKNHFADFRQRVTTVMGEKLRQGESIGPIEAENIVWRNLEEELLALNM
jgi:hypothetical protein